MHAATVRNLLVRGMLGGLAAGLLALVAAYLLGEPGIDAAIGYEHAHTPEHHMAAGHETAPVSRTLQSTAGLATGVLLYGVVFGGIVALAFCFVLGRIGRFGPRATAALLSGAGFVAVYLVPFLKYPANPPAVGDPDTIGRRTALYFLMMLLGVLLVLAAVLTGRRLAARLGNWYATVAAAAGFLVAVGLAYAFLPAVGEVPRDFSAVLLWRFRLAALAVQLVLWTAFGLFFGALAERLLRSSSPSSPSSPSTVRDAAGRGVSLRPSG